MMYRGSAVVRFLHAAVTDPESPGSFRFRKRIERAPMHGRRSPVCDNTPYGICVSRRNAVSASEGGTYGPSANRRLARDRREIREVIDGNREREPARSAPRQGELDSIAAREVHIRSKYIEHRECRGKTSEFRHF